MSALAVIAKSPAPGLVKTRLCPPLSPAQAAELAQASLIDTLAAVSSSGASRRVLVLDGEPGDWLPPGFELIAQRGGGLDERLANAFFDIGGPALIVGMDTPQLSPTVLDRGLRALEASDAVLGPATDGGYWAIGLRRADRWALLGIPMSSPHTLTAQWIRLHAFGLVIAELETLTDLDTFDDAITVAELAPRTRFAGTLGALSATSVAA